MSSAGLPNSAQQPTRPAPASPRVLDFRAREPPR